MFRTVPLSIIREFFTVHAANLYEIYHCCVYSEKLPDDGQRNCPKHVEFYSKNKFEKLVNLVGFIIRINHDAPSPERQKSPKPPLRSRQLHLLRAPWKPCWVFRFTFTLSSSLSSPPSTFLISQQFNCFLIRYVSHWPSTSYALFRSGKLRPKLLLLRIFSLLLASTLRPHYIVKQKANWRCGWCREQHTGPTQRLSRPPPIQKLGTETATEHLMLLMMGVCTRNMSG